MRKTHSEYNAILIIRNLLLYHVITTANETYNIHGRVLIITQRDVWPSGNSNEFFLIKKKTTMRDCFLLVLNSNFIIAIHVKYAHLVKIIIYYTYTYFQFVLHK